MYKIIDNEEKVEGYSIFFVVEKKYLLKN